MQNENIVSQSSFSRVAYNEKKMGAYFTNHTDSRLLSNFFAFPENETVCCLDPCSGDGVALSLVTGRAEGNKNIINFGVELDQERFIQSRDNPDMDYVIQSDFMQDVKISREVFTFAFMNPPYGTSLLGERYEKVFFRKIDTYLRAGAFLVYVVPYYIFQEDESIAKIITNRYDICTCVKFREFDQFKQVAVIMRKKAQNQSNLELAKKFMEYVTNPEKMALIPDDIPLEKRYVVLPSKPEDIKFFEGSGVDMDILKQIPAMSHLPQQLKSTSTISDAFGLIGRPPIMPGKSHTYMLATCGYGKGVAGSEETGDKHLQRGRVLDGSENRVDTDPVTKKVTLTKRYFKKTLITILQNDGTITKLESGGKGTSGKEIGKAQEGVA